MNNWTESAIVINGQVFLGVMPEIRKEIQNLRAENDNLRIKISMLQEVLGKSIYSHRDTNSLPCPEDCWCWDAESVFINSGNPVKGEERYK